MADALAMVLIISVPFAVVAFVAMWLAPRHRRSAVAVVGWFAILFVSAGMIRPYVYRIIGTEPWQWWLVVLAMAGLAFWLGTRLDQSGRFLVTFVPVLVVALSIPLATSVGRIENPPPAMAATDRVDVGAPPGIWVVVLDAHEAPNELRDLKDVDLAVQVEHLEDAGFRVWDDSRSNYNRTLVSVSSMLSGEAWGAAVVEQSLPAMLAGVRGDTNVVAGLKETGQTVRMIPANWSLSECGDLVDTCIGATWYDERWYYLLATTPLVDLLPTVFPHVWPTGGLRALEAMSSLPDGGSHFTLVHSLAAHPPAVFDAECKAGSPNGGNLESQLSCVHHALLASVNEIDLDTDIVIVVADHGYRKGAGSLSPASWPDAAVRSHFSAFTAISTPGNCEAEFPDRLSAAQILPLTLNCYGAEMPIPESTFFAVDQLPYGGLAVTQLEWDGWTSYSP